MADIEETMGASQENTDYIKMDCTLKTPEERKNKVQEIIDNTPPEKLNPYYLTKMADYILDAIYEQEKKEGKKNGILTEGRMVTVNKREVSFEGLVDKFEGSESAVHNIIANDKNIIFSKKAPITKKDLEEIPFLKDLRAAINELSQEIKTKSGKQAYILGQQLKEMRQMQYIIKETYRKPIRFTHPENHPINHHIDLYEEITVDKAGEIQHTGIINLFNHKHVSLLLQYYPKLKEDSYSQFTNDMNWLLQDLEFYTDKALKEKYPLYYDLLIYKIDGMKNIDIQKQLEKDYGIKHSVEYISSLWRNKIPKLIAEEAAREWLIWYYTFKEKGKWKKCSKCEEIKLAHPKFYSKNKTSKDGYYSICKECRNKKYKEAKQKNK